MTTVEDDAGADVRDAADALLAEPVRRAPLIRASLGRFDERDRRLERALRLIDPAVAGSFTPAQRQAIRIMLGLRRDRCLVADVSGGYTFNGRRYFLSLLCGHERRTTTHRREGFKGWLRENVLTLAFGGLLLALLFGMALFLRS